MASAYVFRDTLEAEKDRQHELATQGLANPLQPGQTAAPAAPAQPQAPAAQPLGAPPAAPKPSAPSQPSNPFEAFGKALEAQNPFKNQVQQSVQTSLANPYEGADAANKAARDRLAREQNAAQEQARNDAITAYGGGATGQVMQSDQQVRNARLMNEQAFELDAAANRATQGEQVRSNAIGQGTNLIGQNLQAAQTAAGLADTAANREFNAAEAAKARTFQAGESQLDRALSQTQFSANLGLNQQQLAETIRQFNSKEAFDRWALERGIDQQTVDRLWQSSENDKARASQEKIVDKQLSLQASNFKDELSFKKWATEGGWTQDQIARAWQSDEAVKERTSREAIANSEIGSRERMQAVDQVFQAAQADKQATLETMLQSDRIKAQFQISELENAFAEKMNGVEYLQTKDLQAMKQDFEKSLQEAGINAETARQLSDQQFKGLEAQRDRDFNAKQAEVNRLWETGERIGGQEWQTSIQQNEFKQQDLMQQREEALKRGLQTEQIDAELQKVGMQIASQELMSAAQLLQEENEFRHEFMLKYNTTQEEINQNRIKLEDDLLTSMANREGMGLQNDIAEAALADNKVRSAMDLATWGMEIGDGSPEALAPFVKAVGGALSTALKEKGVNLTTEEIEKMIGASGTTGTTETGTGTSGKVGTTESYQNFQSHLDEVSTGFPNNINIENLDSIGKQMATSTPGSWVYKTSNAGEFYKDKTNFVMDPNAAGGTYSVFAKTQEGNDYLWFKKFLDEGLTEAQAIDLAIPAIGKERMAKAYKTITGKVIA